MKDIKKNHSFILKLWEYEFFCVNYGYEKRYKKIMIKVMERDFFGLWVYGNNEFFIYYQYYSQNGLIKL